MSPRVRKRGKRTGKKWGFMAVKRNVIFTGGFLVLSVILLFLVGKLIAPFLDSLLWAGVLTLVIYPVYLWIFRLTRRRRNLAALLTAGLIAIGIVGPTSFLTTVLTRESAQAYETLRRTMQGGAVQDTMSRLSKAPAELLPGIVDEDSIARIQARIENLGASLLSSVSSAISRAVNRMIYDALNFLLKLFVALVAIFYFLREGDRWVKGLRQTVPLSPGIWNLVQSEFSSTFKAVVHGMLLSAAILGILLGVGFKLFGVPLPAFLGMITFFLAPVPFIGPLAAWLPPCAYLLIVNEPAMALGLFAYGGVVIFIVDTMLRPFLIGSISRMPAFFMFIAIMGGIYAYGPLGIFLGPVLLATAMAVAGIYQQIAAVKSA